MKYVDQEGNLSQTQIRPEFVEEYDDSDQESVMPSEYLRLVKPKGVHTDEKFQKIKKKFIGYCYRGDQYESNGMFSIPWGFLVHEIC